MQLARPAGTFDDPLEATQRLGRVRRRRPAGPVPGHGPDGTPGPSQHNRNRARRPNERDHPDGQ